MGHECCHVEPAPPRDTRFRRVLWIALAVNAAMFVIEASAGIGAQSVSLLADAVDFFGDAANYAVSLFVLGLAAAWRARAALLKGATMGGFGLFVLGHAAWNAWTGATPEPLVMGAVGALALAANLGVALMLYRYRGGDANMRSVWLCSRNDAIGNLAVLGAASGVSATGTLWPDLIVAGIMAALSLQAAVAIVRQAHDELRAPLVAPEPLSR